MPQATNKRLRYLIKIIKQGQFDSQESIAKALKSEGFEITQTTLSRDLHKIGAYKDNGVYVMTRIDYAFEKKGRVKSIQYCPPNIIVIKTMPGLAQSTGMFIDMSKINGVAGTVAGDDTIFVALSEADKHPNILKNISQKISY